MTLNELQEVALNIARTKGFFWKHRDDDGALDAIVPKCIAHLHSEVSELYEDFRRAKKGEDMAVLWIEGHHGLKDFDKMLELAGQGHKPVGPASEAADIAIQLAELTAWLGIDLIKAVTIKLAYYATRPLFNGKVR